MYPSYLSIIVVTLLFSAFFSGMEIAFMSARKLQIELEKANGQLPAKLISRFLHYPSRFIGAMLIGNNIALVIYGIAAAALLDPLLEAWLPPLLNSESMILVLQTLISTLVILVIGEFLPKILFRINPNSTLSFLAVPAYLIYLLLAPLMYFFLGLSELLLKYVFGMKTGSVKYTFSAVDFDEYLSTIAPGNDDTADEMPEIQMIQNVRDFHTTKVRECMVPRNEIVAIPLDATISEAYKLFVESQHSKIPVYSETIDNLTGYVHIHDLFARPASLKAALRPVVIVPETMPARRVLDIMTEQRRSVSVVVDEFGGTAGLVTVEDLIEEIFGEIRDEFDVDEFVEKQKSPDEFVLAGRLEIDYLNREYGLNLPVSDEYETLAGLIISHHQSIPANREQIEIGPFSFTILEAVSSRIEKVLLKVRKDKE